MGNLKERIQLYQPPGNDDDQRDWLNSAAAEYHYMHKRVHPKAKPFGWAVAFDGATARPDGKPCGFIIFSSIHFTKLRGEFGYPGLPSKWQVLNLSRMWLHDDLPRNSETVVIAKALKQVQRRWLEIKPPRFPDEPYHIRKIISYSDIGAGHLGTVYKAANFRSAGRTKVELKAKNTRGPGGYELMCYIYDLPEPRWQWKIEMGLPLWESAAVA